MTVTQIVVASISAIASIIAVFYSSRAAARANTKAKEIESTAAPYSSMVAYVNEMQKRMDTQDKEIRQLRTDFNTVMEERMVDRNFVRRMLHDWPKDKELPQPLPVWVAVDYFGIPPKYPETPGSMIDGEEPEQH